MASHDPRIQSSTDSAQHGNGTKHNISNERSDAIAEGKQKAKAVMAASSLNQGSMNSPNRSSTSTPQNGGPATAPAASSNDSTASRKRSRSGSRKPVIPSSSNQPRPTTHELHLDQYTQRDQIMASARYQGIERSTRLGDAASARMMQLQQRRRDPRILPRIKYPAERKRFGDRRTPELRLSRQQRYEQADTLEELIPIRLDIEFEKLRLRDTFTWNIYDRTIPIDLFASGLIEDFRVPQESVPPLMQQVREGVIEQIQDHHPHVFFAEDPLDPHMEYFAYKNDEMRILIRLNITIGSQTLTDQFDWDINNPANSPEDFADQMARELSLSGEFKTAIAHSIREQTQLFTKALYIAGHQFDGRTVEDSDIRDSLLPSPLTSVFRPYQAAKEFAPQMYPLAEQDLERQELVFSREHRQQKRSVNRRGGPSLPDLKERLKTWRTQLVSDVIPDCVDTLEQSGLLRIARRSGKGRKPWKNDPNGAGAGDSDESEDEDEESEIDSPARTVNQGTARTRGMRGAATAAAAAMKANFATPRSQSPDFAPVHHEPRSRRSVLPDDRDDSEQPSQRLIVKLRVPRDRLQALAAADGPPSRAQLRQQQRVSSMGPPSTPGMTNRQSPASTTPRMSHQRQPSADSPGPTPSGHSSSHNNPPPIPPWLETALRNLRSEYPQDQFDGIMRLNSAKQVYEPRIRCNDCPGMIYNTEISRPTDNFRKHLNRNEHAEKRNARLRGPGRS